MLKILTHLGMFILGSWCGVGLMCLFFYVTYDEEEALAPDAAGAVRPKLVRKGSTESN